MSRNIVFEGWLTKSPPIKRIWRTRWRRRWFALRQSCELPGQYFLDYYSDWSRRRLKGTINLDLCEQVDAGLHMERGSTSTVDPKIRGSVFTIQTQSRTYHLEADCEADMEKWVDTICQVCGLRATDDSSSYQNNLSSMCIRNEQYEGADSTGPYIPIFECITGVRAQDSQTAFTFDPNNIVMSMKPPFERLSESRPGVCGTLPPRLNNPEQSENDSNLSDDDCKSLNASQSIIKDWPARRSFTKSAVTSDSPKLPTASTNESTEVKSEEGPPVPPRPPKTFTMSRDLYKETLQIPKIVEPEGYDGYSVQPISRSRVHRRLSANAPSSPNRSVPSTSNARYTDDEEEMLLNQLQPIPRGRVHRRLSANAPSSPNRSVPSTSNARYTDDEEEMLLNQVLPIPSGRVHRRLSANAPSSTNRSIPSTSNARYTDDEEEMLINQSMQYCNLSSPPTVDRALKPRPTSHNIGPMNSLQSQFHSSLSPSDEAKQEALQYLDLDLPVTSSTFAQKQPQDTTRRGEVAHGRASSSDDSQSVYKTVDFVKTEAFNITRQDAEASRNSQQ